MDNPKIRFKGFTDAWEQRKLGEIVKRVNRKNQDLVSTLPLTISAQYGLIDQNEFFDKRVASKDVSSYYLVRKGEFAYNKSTSSDAPWGVIKRLDKYENGVLSTLYIVFAINENAEIDSDYLVTYYNTNLWHRGIREIAAEGARNHGLLNIAPADFFKTSLSIPRDIEEQKAIGKYFTELNSLITLYQRKCDKIKELKKYMLKKMFPQNGMNTPEIRFAGFTDAWEQRKLREIAGRTYGGGTPKTAVVEYWNGNIPWIQSSNLTEHELFNPNIQKYITNEGLSKSAAQLVPPNSIAVVSHVGVGKLVFIPFSYTTSQDFISLSELKAEPIFTCYSIYKKLQNDIHIVQGSAIKGITKDDLLNKEILLPSEPEQIKIGNYFHTLDLLITLHQCKYEELINIKKFMLKKMFV